MSSVDNIPIGPDRFPPGQKEPEESSSQKMPKVEEPKPAQRESLQGMPAREESPGVAAGVGQQALSPLAQALKEKNSEKIRQCLQNPQVSLDVPNDQGESLIKQLVDIGNVELVKLALVKGADPNVPDREGWRPLHAVAYNGRDDLVKLLLENGADPNLLSDDGESPLLVAALNGQFFVAERLCQRGADPNIANNKGASPLAITLMKENKDLCRLLVENGVDLNRADAEGWTPLHHLVNEEKGHLMPFLLQLKADPTRLNKAGQSPMDLALAKGDRATAQALLFWACKHKGSGQLIEALAKHSKEKVLLNAPDDKGASPIEWALISKNYEAVDLLIAKGVPLPDHLLGTDPMQTLWPQACGPPPRPSLGRAILTGVRGAELTKSAVQRNTPLTYACRGGSVELIQALMEKGVDVRQGTGRGTTPLQLAAAAGSFEAVQFLLKQGAEVDGAFLREACSLKGCEEILIPILEGPEGKRFINEMDNENNTLLHYACEFESMELVRTLLRLGADPRAAKMQGGSALMQAIHKGNLPLLKPFLEDTKKAKEWLNGDDGFGATSFSLAMQCDNPDVIAALIEAGADIHQKTAGGQSPLMAAVVEGSEEAVKLLLERKADPNVVDHSGTTALDYALEKRRPHLVTLLLQARVDPNTKDRKGNTPLHRAISSGDIKSVEELLADPRTDTRLCTNEGFTPLMLVAGITNPEVNKAEMMSFLIKRGADVYAVENRWTALHHAARGDDTELAKILIGAGLKLEELDPNPLEIALRYQKPKMAAFLIQQGAPFTQEGCPSPWMLLCDACRSPGCEILIENILQDPAQRHLLNSRDQYGNTLLKYAVKAGNAGAVRVLVAEGAKPTFTVQEWEGDSIKIKAVFKAANQGSVVPVRFSEQISFVYGKELTDIEEEVNAIATAVLCGKELPPSGLTEAQQQVYESYRLMFGNQPIDQGKLKTLIIAMRYPLPSGVSLLEVEGPAVWPKVFIVGEHRWMVGAKLGAGTYGTVNKAANVSQAALSAMKRPISNEPRAVADIQNEARLLHMVGGKRGIQGPPLAVLGPNGETGFITDRLYDGDGRDLLKFLDSLSPKLSPEERQKTLLLAGTDLWHGVSHLHAIDIFHHDIKRGNVLVVNVNGKWQVVLADLGSSYHSSELHPQLDPQPSPLKKYGANFLVAATPVCTTERDINNMLQERGKIAQTKNPQPFVKACQELDVFQTACVLEEWLSGRQEEGESSYMAYAMMGAKGKDVDQTHPVVAGRRGAKWDSSRLDAVWEENLRTRKTPQPVIDLLKKCLDSDPAERPKSSDMPALWEAAIK